MRSNFYGFTLRFAAWLSALWIALPCGVAWANPQLDEAKRLVTELEFDAALASFQAAIDSGELTRDELVDLLSERTLVLHALHRESELVEDFIWLAALSPEHILDMRAPPAMVAMWKSVRDQSRGPLGVKLTQEVSAGELRLRAELTGTVPEGARARLAIRDPSGSWEIAEGPERTLALNERLELAGYAQALGLGGLVVAEDGNAESPRSIVADPSLADEGGAGGRDGTLRRRRAWIIGTCAVAVAAAAGVATYFLVHDDGEKAPTNLNPMVTF
ncbi:MAG: hypothetical protein QM778_23455 [Myxococcales bacterium]